MTQEKHTPAPWIADFHGHIMAHNGTTNVASTWTTKDDNYPNGRPYKANARLIAAAPELLSSCKAMMKYMEEGFLIRNVKEDAHKDWILKAALFVKDLNIMHQAIAKAEGVQP